LALSIWSTVPAPNAVEKKKASSVPNSWDRPLNDASAWSSILSFMASSPHCQAAPPA
jgi:hypothetical protein